MLCIYIYAYINRSRWIYIPVYVRIHLRDVTHTAQKCRPCARSLSQCTRNAMHSRSPSLSANPSVGRATAALIRDGCGGGDDGGVVSATHGIRVCTCVRTYARDM